MELRNCALPLVGLLLAVIPAGATGYYETYNVERDCRSSGNLTVPLSDAGPRSSVLLKATERTSYSLAMDCGILLSAPDGSRILMSVREIGFRTHSDGSCKDYLQVPQINRLMCAHLFREDEERHFCSSGNTMELLYHVSQEEMDNSTFTGHPGFQVVVTAFTEAGEECPSDGGESRYLCENGHCIWSGLRCDSHNNCGDLSDERDCGADGGSNSTVLVILGALILLLLFIMCVATLLCTKNDNVRRLSNRIRSRTISYLTSRLKP